MSSYVPLRVLSAFSMLEGAIDPKDIAKTARARGYPAIALTDRNGLYAVMPFSEACRRAGVQPVVGTLLAVARPGGPESRAATLDWLALYAQDEAGYANLSALVSSAHLDRPVTEEPHVALDALGGRTEGLIALTAGGEGAVARLLAEGQATAASSYLQRLAELFPDRLYVEIARRGDPVETAAEPALIDLAYARDLPLVATNPATFAEPALHPAHDVLLCIANSAYVDSDERVRSSPEAWLKPADLMADLFADLPEAIANTAVVAQRCAIDAPARSPILPTVAQDEAETLKRDALAGLAKRLTQPPFASSEVEKREQGTAGERVSTSLDMSGLRAKYPEYFARLEFEVDVIAGMGFSGYFLIVADFIQWAKRQGIPVGPGRGSGAGSLVAWALTITDLDPIPLGLLFERFLNPERVSMPDFDIDFCETRRGEVIRYVQDRYGADRVAQIITFGRLKARAVLKDTGRVLQMSYGQVDRLAKLIPNHPTDPWTLKRSLDGVADLAREYRGDAQVRRLFDLARELEGLPRHASTHAAGVVIADRPLQELVPLHRDPRSDMPVTQFDMKYVEAAGLVKFDFLGLKTLSVLKRANELGVAEDFAQLPLDDRAVFELLKRADTVGVFQLESEGMRRTLAAVKPTAFEDIIALVSLYRPGPMDNIPMFGRRKNGAEPIAYPHALLEPVLRETYGIFVYQEQVMEAARVLAGYSLGEADLLRRAMGKKIQAEMDAQRERFVSGCGANGIGREQAGHLFELIDKFAGYGFNKSHAAAYALVAYQTAWLKAHRPVHFYAASMCYDMGTTEKLCIFVDDLRRAGLACLPPCINASAADFTVEGDDVRYALGALKGVGEAAMATLVAERERGGPFRSLEDLAERIDPRQLNRKQLESLAASGALDSLEPDGWRGDWRAALFTAAETILAHAASAADARESGQGGLFGGVGDAPAPIRLPQTVRWTRAERMNAEREAFGFFFSAHPIDRFRHVTQAHGAKTLAQLADVPLPADGGRAGATMAALVEDVRWRTSAKGRRFLTAQLSDATGGFEATVFDDEVAQEVEAAARAGACALLTVELDRRPGDDTPRVTVRRVQPCEALSTRIRLGMTVTLDDPAPIPALVAALEGARGGTSQVRVELALSGGKASLLLGRDFQLDGDVAERVERAVGQGRVSLEPLEAKLALAS